MITKQGGSGLRRVLTTHTPVASKSYNNTLAAKYDDEELSLPFLVVGRWCREIFHGQGELVTAFSSDFTACADEGIEAKLHITIYNPIGQFVKGRQELTLLLGGCALLVTWRRGKVHIKLA